IVTYNRQTEFPGVFALLPTLGTALVIVFATQQTLTGRILSWKPLVGLGLISYSFYLWHQPLFVFARHMSL
ncbi:MAG: acyltransferase family protein, partial [Acidimicrobiaceae bacterium]